MAKRDNALAEKTQELGRARDHLGQQLLAARQQMKLAADAELTRSLQAIEKRFESELERSKTKMAKLEASLKVMASGSPNALEALAHQSTLELARLKQECQDLMRKCAQANY